jgi:hypothetical protein
MVSVGKVQMIDKMIDMLDWPFTDKMLMGV